jgi:hypothetical protein
MRIQGPCAKSKPSRQNLQSKSFRLLSVSALPVGPQERPLHYSNGDRNQSVALVTTEPFVRVPQIHAARNKLAKLIKRSNPSPIRHKLAGREATVKLPGFIND